MLRTRLIPVLLLKDNVLVKTLNFDNPKYVGDPINAVRIFNEKQVDELMLIDIDAAANMKEPNFNLISKISAECMMPLCYAGGISKSTEVEKLISLGVEKVGISSYGLSDHSLFFESVRRVGSQSVMAIFDFKQNKTSPSYSIYTHNGSKLVTSDCRSLINSIIQCGVGEICINSIDRDGTCIGFDIDLIKSIVSGISIPITVMGGAGSYNDMIELLENFPDIAIGVGSFFVFKGKFRAVLIQYPDQQKKDELFSRFYRF